jgi:hypothetical protein
MPAPSPPAPWADAGDASDSDGSVACDHDPFAPGPAAPIVGSTASADPCAGDRVTDGHGDANDVITIVLTKRSRGAGGRLPARAGSRRHRDDPTHDGVGDDKHHDEDARRWSRLTVVQLRDACRHRRLPATGKKADLVARLRAHDDRP